ncbi:MAG: hypothetical protein M1815_005691 [Lichina confinis]|nr:MAG: hypothetical protein M1815_005691 [Lichina confinis]
MQKARSKVPGMKYDAAEAPPPDSTPRASIVEYPGDGHYDGASSLPTKTQTAFCHAGASTFTILEPRSVSNGAADDSVTARDYVVVAARHFLAGVGVRGGAVTGDNNAATRFTTASHNHEDDSNSCQTISVEFLHPFYSIYHTSRALERRQHINWAALTRNHFPASASSGSTAARPIPVSWITTSRSTHTDDPDALSAHRDQHPVSGALTSHPSSHFHEPDDHHESLGAATARRRQQQQQQQQQQHERPSSPVVPASGPQSSSSGGRSHLRRTPRLDELRPGRPRSASADSPRRQQSQTLSPQRTPDPTPRIRSPPPPLDPSLSSTTSAFHSSGRSFGPSDPLRPRRARISSRTASAVLYALEAIRTPFSFTPDLAEENASMSELAVGGMSNGGGYNGRATTSNGSSRPTGPVPVPAPASSSSTVRGPREVMRDRELREARKKAERDREVRERQEQETMQRGHDDRRRSGERRAVAGGGAAAGAGVDAAAGGAGGVDAVAGTVPVGGPETTTYRRSTAVGVAEGTLHKPEHSRRTSTGGQRAMPPGSGGAAMANQTFDPTHTSAPALEGRSAGAGTAGAGRPRAATGGAGGTLNPRPVPAPQPTTVPTTNRIPVPAQAKPTAATTAAAAQPGAGPSTQARAAAGPSEGAQRRDPSISSFPHAFERWEALSSHWEGLTSYWIRRLDQNRDDVNREPLAQQMARQITDLSAAGANLFHAVVELQRLRASSERKFQRWFFDTRAEQERSREVQAELESNLRQERKLRAEAVERASKVEVDQSSADKVATEKANADKLVGELRRELLISKEEARRAWEELGRREQEERERTASLRQGLPTLMSGFQVVPMGQSGGIGGGVSREASVNRPTTATAPATATATATATRAEPYPDTVERSPELGRGEVHPGYGASPLDDPFTEAARRGNEPQPVVTNGTRDRSAYQTTGTRSPSTSSAPSPAVPTSRSPYHDSLLLPTTSSGTASGASGSTFYQHQGTSIHGGGGGGGGSSSGYALPPRETRSAMSAPSEEGTVSEDDYELDEDGHYRYDAQGNPIIYRRGQAGQGGTADGNERAYGGNAASGVEYGPAGSWTSGGGVDYSGAGYGSGWETVSRHHHPTRLSEIQEEEDERSRTSMSMNDRR